MYSHLIMGACPNTEVNKADRETPSQPLHAYILKVAQKVVVQLKGAHLLGLRRGSAVEAVDFWVLNQC